MQRTIRTLILGTRALLSAPRITQPELHPSGSRHAIMNEIGKESWGGGIYTLG